MNNNFSQRGGARIDSFNATWPFAKFSVDSSSIRLKVFSKIYPFNKNEIIGLRKYDGIFSLGLLIEHQKTDYPRHIVFWTFNFEKLKFHTETFGHVLGETIKTDAWWRGGP